MKKILPGIFLILFFQVAWSQQSYFIYLQTNGGAPFYLKMNDRVYSSGANGYVILSSLADGSYQFSLGLSNSPIAEERFSLMLSGKDHGYVVTASNDGLLLTNLQTNAITKPQKTNQFTGYSYTKRTDAFTTLLVKALADTSLFYQAVLAEVQPSLSEGSNENEKAVEAASKDKIATTSKPIADSAKSTPIEVKETVSSTPKIENAVDTPIGLANKNDTVTLTVQKEQSIAVAEPKPDSATRFQSNKIDTSVLNKAEAIETNVGSQITRYSESSTSEGFSIVYIDSTSVGRDTIRLLIQNPKVFIQPTDAVTKMNDTEAIEVETDSLKILQEPAVKVNASKPIRKNVCVSQATGADFTKLRRSMVAKNTDEKMMEEARKMFRSKCFTTQEIKMLSALFLSDSGKYRFFDEAYIHVSNSEVFSSLVSEISDEYYVKRFRALVGD